MSETKLLEVALALREAIADTAQVLEATLEVLRDANHALTRFTEGRTAESPNPQEASRE